MSPDVFFVKANPNDLSDMAGRVGRLADAAGLNEMARPGLFYMIKIHFGEMGNDNYIKPVWVKPIADKLKGAGAKAFFSDTNTLYTGTRSNAVDHLNTAYAHGFTCDALGAPVIIADGLLGENQSAVEINQKHYRQVNIANDARAADGLVVVSNVTGHIEAGLAASIKNVGMGLAGRGGKRSQHCEMSPEILEDKCTGCRSCVKWCPASAITVDKIAHIDPNKCIGCGECYAVCRFDAVHFEWSETSVNMQEKLVEHCYGAMKGKTGGILFFNFMTAVTHNCNCFGVTEKPEIPPVGVIASNDIVAVDQAAADLVNKAAGGDLFNKMYPSWDYTVQLAYAEKIGLGSRAYKLITVS
jgi:uncharacterized protein